MLYIDDASAGKHRQPFHSAAHRFWQMHLSEDFYMVAYPDTDPEWFEMSVRTHRERHDNPLMVQVGGDPEEAILTTLEEWWAKRQSTQV